MIFNHKNSTIGFGYFRVQASLDLRCVFELDNHNKVSPYALTFMGKFIPTPMISTLR